MAEHAKAVTPTRRRASTGEPVLATCYVTGAVFGSQVGWLLRWVDAVGGVAVQVWEGPEDDRRLDIHVTVPGGRVVWTRGTWLVHDLATGSFEVLAPDDFEREYVTDYMPLSALG